MTGFMHNWMQDMRKRVFPGKTNSLRVRDFFFCSASRTAGLGIWCSLTSGEIVRLPDTRHSANVMAGYSRHRVPKSLGCGGSGAHWNPPSTSYCSMNK